MNKFFADISSEIAQQTGKPVTFIISVLAIAIWATTGPLFHYSDTWQLVINTGTTIVTFLMVFLIQASQNRDSRAVQLKLDELIRAQTKARNQFADIEEATEEEIDRFRSEFKARREKGLSETEAARAAASSVDEEER